MKCEDCKYRGSYYDDPDQGFFCNADKGKGYKDFIFIDDVIKECEYYEKEGSP